MLDQPRLVDQRRLKMNFISSQVEGGSPSAGSPPNIPRHGLKHEQLDEALQALAIPFDLAVIQWRVTQNNDEGKRGGLLPYAHPPAFTGRIHVRFLPARASRAH